MSLFVNSFSRNDFLYKEFKYLIITISTYKEFVIMLMNVSISTKLINLDILEPLQQIMNKT